jgi:hypothetical protein
MRDQQTFDREAELPAPTRIGSGDLLGVSVGDEVTVERLEPWGMYVGVVKQIHKGKIFVKTNCYSHGKPVILPFDADTMCLNLSTSSFNLHISR